MLEDERWSGALKAYFLRIDEQPLERRYCIWYQELVAARGKLMLSVNRLYRNDLMPQFERIETYAPSNGRSPKAGIEDRLLKNVLLDLIAIDDSPESHQLLLDHYRQATTANDRVAALLALNRSSSPERRSVLEETYGAWHGHLSAYANYLRIVSSGTRHDVFTMIEIEKARPTFDITQPTWCRALFLPMAANNKMLWTDQGIQWLAASVIELAAINATTASRLLNAFQHVRNLKPGLQEKVKRALNAIAHQVPEKESPTIHSQTSAYLSSVES